MSGRTPRAGIHQPAAGGTPRDRIDRLAEALEGRGLDLVLCPELFLGGYDIGEAIRELAEPADGPSAARLARVARDSGTAIAYGYAERSGGRLYNSVLVLDGHGERIANHRKTVLPPGFEVDYFSAATHPIRIFELAGARCAVLICYEVEFPEAVRGAAEAGAEVVLVPTALSERWHTVAHHMIPTRAFENGLWLLYANHAGGERETRYLGSSCAIAPDGTARVRAGRPPALIEADLDLDGWEETRRRLPYLADLPSLRGNLLSGGSVSPSTR